MKPPERIWPVGGYAPGGYMCKCSTCGKTHMAEKRAWQCADCVIQRLLTPEALAKSDTVQALVKAAVDAERERKTFPILKGEGARIDYQLVADHAEQARANHYQTVERLAERGGLSWCELYAVLHNRKWEKMEANEAMIACRALEARYLAAIREVPK